MLRRLLHNSGRQWSTVFRHALSSSAGGLRNADGNNVNWARMRIAKKEQREDVFERNVKKRILEVLKSLEMPRARAPSSNDIAAWRDVLELSDIESMSTADKMTLTSKPLQSWVLMYVLVTKIRTPTHAPLALDIVYKNLHLAPGPEQPYILILATRVMAKLQAEPPMEHIVHTFLELPVTTDRLHFNLLLRTMSRFRPSVHLAKLTTIILDTMQARQLRLSRATYTTLLYNRFVTLELTKRLRERMAFDGIKPNVKELELFLRCFGKHGASRTSAQYITFVRRLHLAQGKSDTHVRAIRSSNSSVTAHDTHLTRSLERPPSSAFQYLQNLVDEETIHASTLQEEQKLVAPSIRGGRTLLHAKYGGPGVSDWTAALHTAARDKRVSSDGLLLLFERSRNAGLAPTLATYTVVLRGLIKKSGDYTGPLRLWRELRSTVRFMDSIAMTVGMDVLIGSGRALEALDLVIKHSTTSETVSGWTRMARRDTALVNALMSSLQEHGWPTAIFHCWDALRHVFGVQPDAITITILLRAALAAERADGSIRGLLGHISMYNPFRSDDPKNVTPTFSSSKAELEARVRSCLRNELVEEGERSENTDNTPNNNRTSSLWLGTPAGPKALELFRSVLLGNFPHLREMKTPARAVWSDNANDASPLRDVARGLGLAYPENRASSPSGGQPTSPHPQISPDERTFHAYIELLGSQRRSSEIPLALAWMRGLDLVPRKETISLALVLFAEVSLRGPLLETYGDISEYKKLVAWLTRWLGESRLPNEAQLRRTFRNLQTDRGGMVNEEEESL